MEKREFKNTIYVADTVDGINYLSVQKVKFDDSQSNDEILIMIENEENGNDFKVARLSLEEAKDLRSVLDTLIPHEPPFA